MNSRPDYRGAYAKQGEIVKTINQDIANFMNSNGFIEHG
jgi:hypothetical protein